MSLKPVHNYIKTMKLKQYEGRNDTGFHWRIKSPHKWYGRCCEQRETELEQGKHFVMHSDFASLKVDPGEDWLCTNNFKTSWMPIICVFDDGCHLRKEWVLVLHFLCENWALNSFWSCSLDLVFAAKTTSSINPLSGNSSGTRLRYTSNCSAASSFLSSKL